MTTEKLNIVWVNPKDLIPYEDNERKISLEDFTQLKASIKRLGFIDPVIVNSNPERKNIIIGGHQRQLAAIDLELSTIPAVYVNCTPEQETEARLRLNRNTGEYDWQKLSKFEGEFLTSIGFSLSDLQMIHSDFSAIDDKLQEMGGGFDTNKRVITFEVDKSQEEWVKQECAEWEWKLVDILKAAKPAEKV